MRSVHLRVQEHDRLVLGDWYPSHRGGKARLEQHHLDALCRYHDRTETQAFALCHRGIKLRQHVGYLRVGPVALEIYPKLDREGPDRDWRGLLFHMLRVVLGVRLTAQEDAPLAPRAGSLYDVLVARFLEETHGLLREGLTRSYREVEENSPAFRGRLLVTPHLRTNRVHKERFYVAYEVHDTDNLPNRILHRALERVCRTSSSMDLLHRAEAALASFPDVSTAPIRSAEWSVLDRLDRRTRRYRQALTLARMVLIDERPDLRWGGREVMALLFDMNSLFEAYLTQVLRGLPGCRIRSQSRVRFWTPTTGTSSWMKPDLIVEREGEPPLVIDAKWKVPKRDRPDDGDLRQIFAYLHAYDGVRGALVYPRAHKEQRGRGGLFLDSALHGQTAFAELMPGGKPDPRALRMELGKALGLLDEVCLENLDQKDPPATRQPEMQEQA
jgi:5-methylcytosine-specific restriction enzyme subunit McrC